MVTILPDPSGLAAGIQQAGGALAQALEQRAQQRLGGQQYGALLDSLVAQGGPVGDLAQSFQLGGVGPQMGQPLLQEALKQHIKTRSSTDALSEILGPIPSPATGPGISVQGPPRATLNVAAEDNIAISDTVTLPNGRKITDEQIMAMRASPHPNIRSLGEHLSSQLIDQQKREYKENADIRSEHRAEIRKMAEPYSDFTAIRDKVSRMDEVKRLIDEEEVSFDQDVLRNAMTALLEDKGMEQIAQVLKTPAQQKMFSLLRPLFNTKELGGSNPSTREMLMTLATLPQFIKSKEANQYIAQVMKNGADEIMQTAVAMRKNRDKGLSAAEFQMAVDEAVEPIRQKNRESLQVLNEMAYQANKLRGVKPESGRVFVFNPDDKQVYDIDRNDLEFAKKRGGMVIYGN